MDSPIKIAIPLQGKYLLYTIKKSTANKRGYGGHIFWIKLPNRAIKTDNLWYIDLVDLAPNDAIIGEMSSKDEITNYDNYTFKI